MSGYDLSEYVDAKQRIDLFIAKYPEGSLVFEYMGNLDPAGVFIWGRAYAYRTPNDPQPGVGTAQELAQGKTTFTRGSELMNLETSCWARSIAALGIGLTQGIATRQEIAGARNRQESMDIDKPGKPVGAAEKPAPALPQQAEELDAWDLPKSAYVDQEPICDHGIKRVFRSGTSEKTGKHWEAWMCDAQGSGQQCKPLWA